MPESSDSKRTILPKHGEREVASVVPLDSGPVAQIPTVKRKNRGPFDIGLLNTWIIYIILAVLIVFSLAFLIVFICALTTTMRGVPAENNAGLKFFGVVFTSTVLVACVLMLSLFLIQHVKDLGWCRRKKDKLNDSEQVKINALYSVDTPNQPSVSRQAIVTRGSSFAQVVPVSPSQLVPRYTASPYKAAPMSVTYV